MAGYKVVGPAVVLPTLDKSERYLYRGAVFGDGYTQVGIDHALALGLVEAVPDVVDPAAEEAAAQEAKAAADKAAAEKAAAAVAAKQPAK